MTRTVKSLPPKKPDIAFPFMALGETYTLEFHFNTLCDFEEEKGIPFPEFADKLKDNPKISDMRMLFAYGLREHHPDVTPAKAGEIIMAMGPINAMGLLSDAMGAVMSQNREG